MRNMAHCIKAAAGIACLTLTLSACGQARYEASPAASTSVVSHRDRTHKERAEDVLGPEGFTLTQDQTDLAGIPDRVELTTADDLLARITWQKVAPELDLNFPDAGRLPGGTPFRYQVTGYGGVSALVMHGDEAVILTIVPSHKAIASGKSDKVMPEGKVAAMAQRLLEG